MRKTVPIKSELHQRYYLALEQDFWTAERYVALDDRNRDTHSIHFTLMISAACAECDVIGREIFRDLRNQIGEPLGDDERTTIDDHKKAIQFLYPEFYKISFYLPPTDSRDVGSEVAYIQPFGSWEHDVHPYWWDVNRNLKHHRSVHYHEATLAAAVCSLAGLLALIAICHNPHEFYEWNVRNSRLFTIMNHGHCWRTFGTVFSCTPHGVKLLDQQIGVQTYTKAFKSAPLTKQVYFSADQMVGKEFGTVVEDNPNHIDRRYIVDINSAARPE